MPSKWLQVSQAKKYEEHRKRVREARCTIDKVKPPEMPMSMRRESERRRVQSLIEQDNRLLLDRLADAMSRKNIDNELIAQPFVSYLSLQRKKNLVKIMDDNKRLLGRIQTTVPTLHHEEWERDHQKRVEYLRNMTEFPDYFIAPGTMTMVTEGNIHEENYQTYFIPKSTLKQSSGSPLGDRQRAYSRGGQPAQGAQGGGNTAMITSDIQQGVQENRMEMMVDDSEYMMTPQPPPLPPPQGQGLHLPAINNQAASSGTVQYHQLQGTAGNSYSGQPGQQIQQQQQQPFVSRPYQPNGHSFPPI